jgi:hypothetical protein
MKLKSIHYIWIQFTNLNLIQLNLNSIQNSIELNPNSVKNNNTQIDEKRIPYLLMNMLLKNKI